MNMKRINLLMVVMLFAWCQVMAIPAHKGVVKVQQPDGTSVSICLHGDEWVSFTTTEDGYSVVKEPSTRFRLPSGNEKAGCADRRVFFD